MAYQSDYWHSTGAVAYDADGHQIPPACPVCGSTRTEAVWGRRGSQPLGRRCTDEQQHRAALATPDGQSAASAHAMAF